MINDSLAILSARYSQIQPTSATVVQFISDITNILGTVEELLFRISNDLTQVCGESTSKIMFSIHSKCNCLATSLVLVGVPLEILYKVRSWTEDRTIY
jgi:hypothetical protein